MIIRRKVNHSIVKLCRALSNIYLQQNGFMNKFSFNSSALMNNLADDWLIWFDVIRRDLVLAIFRNEFSLFRSFNNYFWKLIFIPVERANCWELLGEHCFC